MSGPIRVAHVVDEFALAGAQRVLLANLRLLDRERFRHVVFAVHPSSAPLEPLIRDLGIWTVTLGARGARDLPFAALRLWRGLRAAGADVVHTQIFQADVVGRVGAVLARLPVITTFQNPVFESTQLERSAEWQDRLQLWTFRLSSTRAIAVSEAVKRSVAHCLGDPAATVIRNSVAIDLEHWKPITAEERRAARSRYGLRDDEVVFGNVARLSTQKAQHFLLDAIAKVPGKWSLLLIGDGPLRGDIERQATALGIAERVTITGWLPDSRTAVAACDALVLSSLWEGDPLTLLEGMAAGLPFVSTTVGGVDEVARDGETAFLVPPADVDALARALRRLADGPETRSRMSCAARARAQRIIDPAASVRRLEQLYEEVARRP